MASLRELFSPRDMTEGAPWKRILEFTIPMLIGNIAQQLYNTADSIIVGQYVGDNALAAVGNSGPIINLLLVLFMGVSVGASIMASQYFGAKDKKRLSHSVGTAITATFAGPPTAAPAIEFAMSIKYRPTPVLSRKEPNRINKTIKVEQTPMGVPMTPSVV